MLLFSAWTHVFHPYTLHRSADEPHNPFILVGRRLKCTVTVTQIPEDHKWWYMGCAICKKKLTIESGTYYCSDCKWPTAIPRKFSLIEADETAEAKKKFLDVVARQIIRRNCNSLLKSVKQAPGLPTQILAVISKKFTFAIGLTDESYRSMAATTYLVDSFVFRPNQQPPLPKPVLTLEAPPHHTAQETHSAYHYRKQSC